MKDHLDQKDPRKWDLNLATRKIIPLLEQVRSNINRDGSIDVKDLWNLKKNVNEWLGSPDLDKNIRSNLKKTLGGLNETLGKYGSENPEFTKTFYPAEEMYKAIHKGSLVNKTLQKNFAFQNLLNKYAPLSAIGYGLLHFNLAKPATIAGVTAAGFGAKELVKMTEFLYNSPQARKYYASMMKAAAAGDGARAAKDLMKIDQLAAKEEGKMGRYQLIS